jgi:4-amino-4-deoxy-L-arabinose transferase-like glycosyltransferase
MKFESLTSLQALQHPKHKRNIFTLILFVSLAILPFLNQRVLRMAGDEKVYISQSIEMAQNNTWFQQTLAGEPSYYKGPFHYIFVRVGLYLFGDSLVSGLWMNWLMSVLIALLMYFAIESRIRNHESSFLMGLTAALNIGVFSHVFASQMEVELTFFYVLCIFALCYFVKQPKRNTGLYLFWFSAGMAGTIKSPVHSVLLGASGLLFWLWWSWSAKVISIKSFLKNKHLYFSILFGIATCVMCYVPIVLWDWKAFYETYLLREQFNKDKNYRAWHYVVTPLLYFTFPLSLYVLSSFTRLLKIRITNMFKASDLTGVQIGLAMASPTILFWSLWSYKGQNYNLPTVPVLIFLAFATYRGYINTKSLKWVGYAGLLAPVLSWIVIYRFLATAGLVALV